MIKLINWTTYEYNDGVLKLIRHLILRTTMIYTHVSNEHISKIQSPLDKI